MFVDAHMDTTRKTHGYTAWRTHGYSQKNMDTIIKKKHKYYKKNMDTIIKKTQILLEKHGYYYKKKHKYYQKNMDTIIKKTWTLDTTVLEKHMDTILLYIQKTHGYHARKIWRLKKHGFYQKKHMETILENTYYYNIQILLEKLMDTTR